MKIGIWLIPRIFMAFILKNKGDEVEEEIIIRDYKELKDIFRLPDLNECLNRFTQFISNLTPDKE